MVQKIKKEVTLTQAFIPLIFLLFMLYWSVDIFGDDSSYGATQIALLFSAGVAAIVGAFNGYKWDELQDAISNGITKAFSAILILLMVGSLIGTWILSGTVPAMIYYGLQILSPTYFYATVCIICAVSALSIGSSWSVAGTVGVGMMGVSTALGLDPAITAGAVISGAYFGDKMSPLSDTTNLAPAIAGTDLFSHIAHMRWTTIPAIVISIIIYAIIGLNSDISTVPVDNSHTLDLIEQYFNIGPHLFIPLIVLFVLAIKKFPAFPSLFIGAILGAVFAIIFQSEGIMRFANSPEESEILQIVRGVWMSFFGEYSISTGDAKMDKLFNRGGMASMLNTIWLIMCAITFGAVMERLGMLKRLIQGMLSFVHSAGSLIFVTALTCLGMNAFAGEQYVAIIIPGRMFRLEYRNRNLHPLNLSRALEDTATVTSVLFPWNTCGLFMATALMVPTFDFALFCFFNLLSPVISVLYGFLNFTILPLNDEEEKDEADEATA